MSPVSGESSGAPRVLLDATAVPADRGASGATSTVSSGPSARPAQDLVVVCQRSDAERFHRLRRRRRRRRRAVRHRAPPGPAGLGADRPAAGRPAGRRRRDPLAVLHDAAARAGARRGHRARRDVLLRARAAQRGQDRLLPVGDPHRGAAGHPAWSCRRRPPGTSWSGCSTPTRPASTSPTTASTPPPSTRRRETETRRVNDRLGPARQALRRLPRRARAAQERARPGPRLGRGRRRTCADPPALVLAGSSGWDDGVDQAVAEVPDPPARSCAPATCGRPTCPGLLGGALVVAYPSKAEGFGLPVLEAMACGAAVLTARRLSLPEVGGDAVAYTEPDADSIATALRALIDDPQRRAVLSPLGRRAGPGVHLGGLGGGAPRDLRAGRRRGRPRPLTQPSPTRTDETGASMTEAVLLVGGKGTRLRPLTVDTPKPMLPTAGVPFLHHLLAAGPRRRDRPRGARHVVPAGGLPGRASATGPRSGCGSTTSPRTCRWAPAAASATCSTVLESGPDDPVVILNGDILSGHDLAAQVAAHRASGADVTLHLSEVEDPRAFGCVPTDDDRPGDRVPGEDPDAGHQPDQRRLLRVHAVG